MFKLPARLRSLKKALCLTYLWEKKVKESDRHKSLICELWSPMQRKLGTPCSKIESIKPWGSLVAQWVKTLELLLLWLRVLLWLEQ